MCNMNNKFSYLAEKAGLNMHNDPIDGHDFSHELEKFAELIVQECAELVRIQNEQFMENESHYGVVPTDVSKHFGVEE